MRRILYWCGFMAVGMCMVLRIGMFITLLGFIEGRWRQAIISLYMLLSTTGYFPLIPFLIQYLLMEISDGSLWLSLRT